MGMSLTLAGWCRPWGAALWLTLVWPITAGHVLYIAADGKANGDHVWWWYELQTDETQVFTGTMPLPFAPGGVAGLDYTGAARDVLELLTRRPGDGTPGGYEYDTAGQRAWRDKHAQELALYALTGVCGYCETGHDSPTCPKLRKRVSV